MKALARADIHTLQNYNNTEYNSFRPITPIIPNLKMSIPAISTIASHGEVIDFGAHQSVGPFPFAVYPRAKTLVYRMCGSTGPSCTVR